MWNFNLFSKTVALITDKDDKIPYDKLLKLSDKLFKTICNRALIFCLCSNTAGSVVGYVSFIQNKCVPVMLSAGIDDALLERLISLYQPNYIWRPQRQQENYDDYVAGKDYELSAQAADADDGNRVVFSLYGYELIDLRNKPHSLHPDLALLLSTSGSTGSPKFVRQSYKNIQTNAEQIVRYLELDSSERPITTLPMNYTYGLSIINSHLMVGATILLTDKGLMQKDFWQFFKEQEATSFGGVPYTYEMLDKLRFERMNLPSLRYMTQAGGKLSPELHKKFAQTADKTGKKFIVMYGQCEATARMSYLPAEDSLRKYGSIGIAIPGGRFELTDADNNVITEPDTPGELVYYGDNVTLGYAKKPEDLSLGDERGGRLETGDIAVRDAEGYYKIVGRKKRFLKVYGNRVNLDELDGILRKQYNDNEIVCAGTDDHVVIFVMNDKYNAADHEGIRAYLADRTHLNIAAFRVVGIDSIPRNDAGKIQYVELEKYYS